MVTIELPSYRDAVMTRQRGTQSDLLTNMDLYNIASPEPGSASGISPRITDFFDNACNRICNHPDLEMADKLESYLRLQGHTPPDVRLQIKGEHWGAASASNRDDRAHVSGSRWILDFDFHIELTRELLIDRNPNAQRDLYMHRSDVLCYRNSMYKRRESADERQNREDLGRNVLQQAIAEYCSCTRSLKEFQLQKVVSGWDLKILKTQINRIIATKTDYEHEVQVLLRHSEEHVLIRPHNRFSRYYNNDVVSFFRYVLFPLGLFLYVLQYLYFGKKWSVVRASYELYHIDTSTGAERGLSSDRFLVAFEQQIVDAVGRGAREETLPWPVIAARRPAILPAFVPNTTQNSAAVL